MSNKPTREEYLQVEDDLLRGLLEAAGARETDLQPIEIVRKGKKLFSFAIRALTEEEYLNCREQATTYERSSRMGGLRMPKETNAARYRSLLIYTATAPADRKALWDNRQAWDRLNVVSGPDLIEVVLLAGEKDAVVTKLDEISGYGDDLEETAKN